MLIKNMNVDSFFTIGSSHQICEDYIIHGNNPIPFVILSDGCSSSPQTDVGARLLVHTASNILQECSKLINADIEINHSLFNEFKFVRIGCFLKDLNLPLQCLDATLIVSYKLNNFIYIHMYGDGKIVTINKENEVNFITVSYKNEMPYYLSYLLDKERNNLYVKEMGGQLTKTIQYSGEELKHYPYNHNMFVKYNMDKYKGILIMSDGSDSFVNPDNTKVGNERILQEFTSFKNVKGSFIKRRIGRALKTLTKEGIRHYDDLAIGGFYNGGGW